MLLVVPRVSAPRSSTVVVATTTAASRPQLQPAQTATSAMATPAQRVGSVGAPRSICTRRHRDQGQQDRGTGDHDIEHEQPGRWAAGTSAPQIRRPGSHDQEDGHSHARVLVVVAAEHVGPVGDGQRQDAQAVQRRSKGRVDAYEAGLDRVRRTRRQSRCQYPSPRPSETVPPRGVPSLLSAGVAQLAAHPTCNRAVPGSNPGVGSVHTGPLRRRRAEPMLLRPRRQVDSVVTSLTYVVAYGPLGRTSSVDRRPFVLCR